MASKIQILDVTLRDGEQTSGVAFAAAEKLDIAQFMLQQLKVNRIEIASASVSTGELQTVQQITKWAQSISQELLHRIEILGFVDGRRSTDWVEKAGAKVINLLVKGSKNHCEKQLGKTLVQHLKGIEKTVGYAKDRGLDVNIYLEDWSNGFTDSRDYVYQLVDALSVMPIGHYMLPDTLGVFSPDKTYSSLSAMLERFPTLEFDFHAHNDYGLALANCLQAVKAGLSNLHCTINCLGERAGNVSLAEIVVALKDLIGCQFTIDERKLVAASELVQNYSGKIIGDNAPIIGRDVFTQTAGIHADGDSKGNLYHTKLHPSRFQRKHTYALGKLSGKASLRKNIEALGIALTVEEQQKLLIKVIQLGDEKHQIDTRDLPLLIADMRNSADRDRIKLIDCTETSSFAGQSMLQLTLEVDGQLHRSTGVGNGGFSAFVDACNKILQIIAYQLPELLDFKIVISRSGSAKALTECFIVWQTASGAVRTRGVHLNQVFAGVLATLRLINAEINTK